MSPSQLEKVGLVVIVITDLAILALGPITVGRCILQPIDRAIRATRRRLRFELADFLWLLVQLQIVLAVVVNYVPQTEPAWMALLLSFLLPATMALWYGSTQAMLRAGVKRKGRRALFVLLVLPSVLVVMMGITIFYLGCPVVLADAYRNHRFSGAWPDAAEMRLAVMAFVLVTCAAPLICWALRRTIDWILADVAMSDGDLARGERANS